MNTTTTYPTIDSLESLSFRFYPRLYSFPYEQGLKRMLLEGRDLDLYVWIEDGRLIDSFQLIYKDRWMVRYKHPKEMETGEITRDPINRCMSGELPKFIREELIAEARRGTCEDFPNLMSIVVSILEGAPHVDRELADSEQGRLAECVVD